MKICPSTKIYLLMRDGKKNFDEIVRKFHGLYLSFFGMKSEGVMRNRGDDGTSEWWCSLLRSFGGSHDVFLFRYCFRNRW